MPCGRLTVVVDRPQDFEPQAARFVVEGAAGMLAHQRAKPGFAACNRFIFDDDAEGAHALLPADAARP